MSMGENPITIILLVIQFFIIWFLDKKVTKLESQLTSEERRPE